MRRCGALQCEEIFYLRPCLHCFLSENQGLGTARGYIKFHFHLLFPSLIEIYGGVSIRHFILLSWSLCIRPMCRRVVKFKHSFFTQNFSVASCIETQEYYNKLFASFSVSQDKSFFISWRFIKAESEEAEDKFLKMILRRKVLKPPNGNVLPLYLTASPQRQIQ